VGERSEGAGIVSNKAELWAKWLASLTVEDRYDFDSEGRGYKKDGGHMMHLAFDAGIDSQAAEIVALREENFKLAAGQCVNASGDEGGTPQCKEIAALRDAVSQFHHAMNDAGWHPGRTDDSLPDIIRAKGAEIAQLRSALKKANDQAEHFEREWYLRGDVIERAARVMAGEGVADQGEAWDQCLRILDAAIDAARTQAHKDAEQPDRSQP
jgi:hypothetical protein